MASISILKVVRLSMLIIQILQMIINQQQYKFNINIIQSTMQQEQPQIQNKSSITARMFDFIYLHPSHIQHISFGEGSNKLFVARSLYSEIYTISNPQNPKSIIIEQIMTLQPCQKIYQIDGLIVMLLPFQLKINDGGKWAVYPFTTQLLPLSSRWSAKNNKLYTFHLNQCRQWSISQEEGVDIRHLSKNQIPYHVTAQGILQGMGKNIKPNNFKDNKFTIVEESHCGRFLFIGSSKGHLHIYQSKYLTHVKTFHRHEGSIQAIKCTQNMVYFTGSDSKISSVVLLENNNECNWMLSKEVRGQSHDILSIQNINIEGKRYLISGGITTDMCFYELSQSGSIGEQKANKVSYSCKKLVDCVDNYLIVNKFNSFQIWKIGESEQQSKQNVELIVKYQLPFYKSINQMLSKKQQKSLIIFICTQQQATLWSFDEQQGLTKLLTVKNSYNLACWYKKQSLMTIRDGNRLQIFNFKNGNIVQLAQTQVQVPTDLVLSPGSQQKILISSKHTLQFQILQILPQKQKQLKTISSLSLQKNYNIIDFCYYNPNSFMIKYSNDDTIRQMNKKGQIVTDIVKLPVKNVRNCGWLQVCVGGRAKMFWYAYTQGKIVVVSRMKAFSKVKKVRVKQMPRIADVVVNSSSEADWDFGVIPYNFSKMIEEEINPIITKKIL